MKRLRIVELCVLAGAFGLFVPRTLSAQDGKPKADSERLQGAWQVVSVEQVYLVAEEGKPSGQPPTLKAVRKVRGKDRCQFEKWTFKGSEVIRQEPLLTTTYEYRLDPKKNPQGIDFTELFVFPVSDKREPGSTQLGVYRLEGDTLTVCVNDELRSNQPEDQRRPTYPTAFEAKADEKQSFTLYKLNRPASGPAPRPATPPEGAALVIAKTPKLLTLAKERHEAAAQDVNGRVKSIYIGRAIPDRLLVEACQQLLRASLDLAKSREEQGSLLEESWARLYAIEDIAERMYLSGKHDVTTYAPVRGARLDAELQLELFRLARPPKK